MEHKLKLTSKEGNEFEDATNYKQLMEILSTSLLQDHIFHLLLELFLDL